MTTMALDKTLAFLAVAVSFLAGIASIMTLSATFWTIKADVVGTDLAPQLKALLPELFGGLIPMITWMQDRQAEEPLLYETLPEIQLLMCAAMSGANIFICLVTPLGHLRMIMSDRPKSKAIVVPYAFCALIFAVAIGLGFSAMSKMNDAIYLGPDVSNIVDIEFQADAGLASAPVGFVLSIIATGLALASTSVGGRSQYQTIA